MIIILGTFLIQRIIIARCTMILYIREHGDTLQKDNAPVQFCSPCIFYITLTLRSVLRVRIYMNSDPYHFASRIRVLTVYRVGLRKSQKTNLIRIPIYISGYLSHITQNWILIKIKCFFYSRYTENMCFNLVLVNAYAYNMYVFLYHDRKKLCCKQLKLTQICK